ncbi:MAG: DUF1850 domain-containing protein [Acidaminococcaceae bacterium]|nr:DUF1850 domain-containing protein [Acidaminococcaceae bacterium]
MTKISSYLRRGPVLALCGIIFFIACWFYCQQKVLKIFVWKTGEVILTESVATGDKIDVFWTHSLEKIPWNEYYTLREDNVLVLDTITFPAFGAGIPANKGKTRIGDDGLIYMEKIGQEFRYFKWLNSKFTREIRVNGRLIVRGTELPNHQVLILRIERRGFPWRKIKNSMRL